MPGEEFELYGQSPLDCLTASLPYCLTSDSPLPPPQADGYSIPSPAQVVKLVDALASGASVRKDVKVRVLSWAPIQPLIFDFRFSIFEITVRASEQGFQRFF